MATIEARRVRVRVQNWKTPKAIYQNITIPTDAEMERIASELHAKGQETRMNVLGWDVEYSPAKESSYTVTEVDYTGKPGEEGDPEPIYIEAKCVFGVDSDVWQVAFRWWDEAGEPQRHDREGKIVGPAIVQRELFNDSFDKLATEPSDFTLADEVAEAVLLEGAVRCIEVNAYERNSEARRRCIEHWGVDCTVCGINFGNQYGEIGEGFIHVHHVRDLATIGGEYEVDPLNDLRPVCPNCHAMLHTTVPAMSIEELRKCLA